jgi:hypothetical protein
LMINPDEERKAIGGRIQVPLDVHQLEEDLRNCEVYFDGLDQREPSSNICVIVGYPDISLTLMQSIKYMFIYNLSVKWFLFISI